MNYVYMHEHCYKYALTAFLPFVGHADRHFLLNIHCRVCVWFK